MQTLQESQTFSSKEGERESLLIALDEWPVLVGRGGLGPETS